MFDLIAGYHLNPLACGVAKFNGLLGRHMSLPVVQLFDPAAARAARPLLSIKVSEFTPDDRRRLEEWLDRRPADASFSLFLHAYGDSPLERRLLQAADRVFCGNVQIRAQALPLRADAVQLWCPGMIADPRPFEPVEISVFSFGMAHKVNPQRYGKLRDLLTASGRSHALYLSVALHENSSLDDSFAEAYREIEEIFDGRVYFLGYLSDDAVHHYLTRSTYFCAFFDQGVRGNNTSVHAAMAAGAVVITNLDEHSPPEYVHLQNVLDIQACGDLPTDETVLRRLRDDARRTAVEVFGWARLVDRITRAAAPHAAPAAASGRRP